MEARVELIKCPNCGVICKIGNDDDFQVFCACCKSSFSGKEGESVTVEEYRRRLKNAQKVYKSGGWKAFKP